jgi:phosphoglycerol transferase
MTLLRACLIFLALFLFFVPGWIHKNFGENVTTEQLLFHLLAGVDGADPSLFKSFIESNLIKPARLTFGVFLADLALIFYFRRKHSTHKTKMAHWLLSIVTVVFLVSATCFSSVKLGVPAYVQSFWGDDDFSDLYHDTNSITFLKPKKKKNLLLIYVESLEYSLRRSQIHGSNLLHEIDALPGQNIEKFHQAPGTGWSIAGMVSSQCSVPLKPYYGNELNTKSKFLPGLTCLGDVLNQNGYTQYFLVGPEVTFSGMDKFYKGHGYNFALGRDEWRSKGLDKTLFTGWGEGLHDDSLLEQAKIIMENETSKGTPYNITMITTDNHAQDGYPSPRCPNKSSTPSYKETFKCTSGFIADFIRDLDSKKLLGNTLVVIMGDHLFMADTNKAPLFPGRRYIYFKLLNAKKPLMRDSMTHFDVAPSILEDLGFVNESTVRFGLGLSLFSNLSNFDYESLLTKTTANSIVNPSMTYDGFWIPRQTKSL